MRILDVEFKRKDKRGSLEQISTGFWRQVNRLFIKKGETFGGHYHKHKEELFYIVKGYIKAEIINAVSNKKEQSYFGEGRCFLIEPYEKHTIIAEKNTEIIELLSKPYSKKDCYE